MGQGIHFGIATLVLEELGGDWSQVEVVGAYGDPKHYGNTALGDGSFEATGGSTSMLISWQRYRKAGAAARMMLVAAAAKRWKVAEREISVANGVIAHGSKTASFGELAAAAAEMPIPVDVPLKPKAAWTKIGAENVRRFDSARKTNGTQLYPIDLKMDGMLTAVIIHPPKFGATVKSFDASKAKTMPGVIDVVQIPDGVAVVADTWWRAKQARDTVVVQWDEGAGAALTEKNMLNGIRAGAPADKVIPLPPAGDAEAAIKSATKVVKAEYTQPLLSHSPMEPMNFTAHYHDGKVDLIGPTQWQDASHATVAKILDVKPEDVTLTTTFLGGGFGRRIDYDYMIQAAQISKAVNRPVKLLWTREDDMTHDFYRPQSLHQVSAALGADGKPTAMTFRMVSQSVTGRVFGLPLEVQDPLMTEAAMAAYEIPATKHEVVKHEAGLRVGYWRSVSHALNAFANETFIDECAAAAGKDPYDYRMSLLASKPRFANVLKIAADKSGWGTPAPAGHFRGIALMEGYDTYMAQVAEVSIKDGVPVVHKVTVAADLGRMVNPDTVEAQIQSSIIFGLSAALYGEITLDKGRVQQTNFHQYKVVRMNEAPQIDITLVASTEKPGGIGEPATALIGPAVGNAVFAATGKRLRKMPMTAENIATA
jgi:isoquinoline 1-oxidoreductase beta subunit